MDTVVITDNLLSTIDKILDVVERIELVDGGFSSFWEYIPEQSLDVEFYQQGDMVGFTAYPTVETSDGLVETDTTEIIHSGQLRKKGLVE